MPSPCRRSWTCKMHNCGQLSRRAVTFYQKRIPARWVCYAPWLKYMLPGSGTRLPLWFILKATSTCFNARLFWSCHYWTCLKSCWSSCTEAAGNTDLPGSGNVANKIQMVLFSKIGAKKEHGLRKNVYLLNHPTVSARACESEIIQQRWATAIDKDREYVKEALGAL